jgi:hypothetical protein
MKSRKVGESIYETVTSRSTVVKATILRLCEIYLIKLPTVEFMQDYVNIVINRHTEVFRFSCLSKFTYFLTLRVYRVFRSSVCDKYYLGWSKSLPVAIQTSIQLFRCDSRVRRYLALLPKCSIKAVYDLNFPFRLPDQS